MGILKRHKNTVYGLNSDLSDLNDQISTETQDRKGQVGTLDNLTTTEKTSLVKAINEVQTSVDNTSDSALMRDNNLSDVKSVQDARTNLNVYSTTEIDDAIGAAKLDLGTSYTVDDITARDLLEDLDVQDRVFVKDDGDTKWAIYKPDAIDSESGAVTGWTKLSDQDSLDNSISAPALKAAYEKNADTNAFTDAEKQKVGYLSVTEGVDLDDAVLKAELVQDVDGTASTTETASVDAIKQYALGAASVGGVRTTVETVAVAGDTITLSHEPHNGVNGIMNFSTVRYIDENNVAYDAPVIASADPKKFVVQTDSMDQWDLNDVKVQYVYLEEKPMSPVE